MKKVRPLLFNKDLSSHPSVYDTPSDSLFTWAEKIIKFHNEGFSPRWKNEVTVARLVLLGVITEYDDMYRKRGEKVEDLP